MKKEKNKIHFIGIGGIGMSSVARLLNFRGFAVSGSDKKPNLLIKKMQDEGIKCSIGHSAKNITDCDTVVYSSSIKRNNVELECARERGLEAIHRAVMLSRVIGGRKSIAVTGSHGKTTTSAVLALIFEKAGLNPSASIGGEALNFMSNALERKGDYFILEADESDGSFLRFNPHKAVLLNIDREHLDYFKNMDNAISAYRRFVQNVKEGGTVYYNADDARLRRLIKKHSGRCVSFGTMDEANIKATAIKQRGLKIHFRCSIKNKIIPGEFTFPMPGRHNVTNALAAIAVASEAGIDFNIIKSAMACYKGVKRRFEIKTTSGGITLIEDYAHHPREIKAVLRACKPLRKNLIVVFQPHRYTRTRDLFKEFINCFKGAGRVILTDIYAAGEKTIQGVTSKRLFAKIKQNGVKNVEYLKKNAIPKRIKSIAGADDMVLVLGAGDINDIIPKLLK